MIRTFNTEEISLVRKELRGLCLMPSLEITCEVKGIATRSTVFRAVNPEKHTGSPVHRLIMMEAIALVLNHGGNVEWFLKEIENETEAERATA